MIEYYLYRMACRVIMIDVRDLRWAGNNVKPVMEGME